MGERGQVSKAILSTTDCWLYPLQANGSQCVESGPAAASFALEIIRSANQQAGPNLDSLNQEFWSRTQESGFQQDLQVILMDAEVREPLLQALGRKKKLKEYFMGQRTAFIYWG